MTEAHQRRLPASSISANPPGGLAVADANVQANLTLNEPLIPPGYAYEQIDFALDYGTINSLTGGIGGAPSFLVSGSASGLGSYAQLGGQINYWWQTSNTTYSVINAAFRLDLPRLPRLQLVRHWHF